jgi:cobalt-zinc-cadmium efflux system outer membrane protein
MNIRHSVSTGIVALSLLGIPLNGITQEIKNLTLQAAIEIAEKNNPGLLALEKEATAERGRAITTWWLANPDLSLEWEGVPTGAGLGRFDERRFTLTQEIEFPTNILWRNRLAAREVDAAEWRYGQGRLETRANAIEAYFRFLAAREGLALAKERVRLAQEFLDKANIRREVGEAPAIETVRASVELARAQNALRGAESAFKASKTRLNTALGRRPDEAISSRDTLAYRPYPAAPLSLSKIKQQALTEHPRLREASAQVSAAGHLRKLAWGSLLPAIQISAFRQNLGGNPNFYGVEVGLKLPLWFAFRQRGEIQQASALFSARENRRLSVQLRLQADIENAYAEFQAVKTQVETYTSTLLDQANEVYRIAIRSYEEGEIGYLQLLEAQQTLIEVRQGYIDTLASYYAAIAALERASGVVMIR